jgi:hypothetical protein
MKRCSFSETLPNCYRQISDSWKSIRLEPVPSLPPFAMLAAIWAKTEWLSVPSFEP